LKKGLRKKTFFYPFGPAIASEIIEQDVQLFPAADMALLKSRVK